MNIQIKESCSPLTEAELVEFEHKLGVLFPQDYRDFLLAHNGGRPSPALFDVDIDGFKNTSQIELFLCLNDNQKHNLLSYRTKYRGRIPANLFVIATELSIDLVCLSISGDDFGSVYFWDHNWETTERNSDYENVHFLAENFTEFMKKLYDKSDF